jgi:hypothetical protein
MLIPISFGWTMIRAPFLLVTVAARLLGLSAFGGLVHGVALTPGWASMS